MVWMLIIVIPVKVEVLPIIDSMTSVHNVIHHPSHPFLQFFFPRPTINKDLKNHQGSSLHNLENTDDSTLKFH